ncbi:hypothetical protein [Streptomyces sp. NBC_01314]|uniref:hypothetical protein n=1 Tax=Streptomyces sp. NBC_01314 TaxID=2903821 RepID=UPI003091E2BA|nr:hypothetical protein OG622_28730 [Streptomyces sp. NBC_01314]
MFCDRCQKPIKPDDEYQEHTPDSASGVAPAAVTHKPLCRSVPSQSYPAVLDGRRRRR